MHHFHLHHPLLFDNELFCGMVDKWKTLRLISSQEICWRFLTSQTWHAANRVMNLSHSFVWRFLSFFFWKMLKSQLCTSSELEIFTFVSFLNLIQVSKIFMQSSLQLLVLWVLYKYICQKIPHLIFSEFEQWSFFSGLKQGIMGLDTFFSYFLFRQKKNIMAPFLGWGSTVSSLWRYYAESVYFLPLSPQVLLI